MRRIILIIFILIFSSFYFFQERAFGDFGEIEELKKTIEEKNQKIKSIQEEILKYQDEIDKKGKESKTLSGEIGRLNLIIGKLNKDIALTRGQIEATSLILERLEIEIEKTRGEIGKKSGIIEEFLREIYDLGSLSTAEILLGRESVSDFFDGLEEIKNLQEKMRLALVELKQSKNNLEKEEMEKSNKKEELTDYQNRLGDKKIIQLDVKKDKEIILKVTKNKEKEYQKLLSQKEKEKQEILAEVDAIEEELRKLVDPASLPKSRPGVLGYPVGNVAITQGFGLTSFSQSSGAYFKGVHNGVDFRASMGAEVFSAEDGTVWETGNTDLSCRGGSYGKWILIKHENNLATLYAHLSLIKVNKGERVLRRQLIGYSGKTGYATGPHLHFTVYDSRTVRFGDSSSGRCRFLPFGGYLNPLDYL